MIEGMINWAFFICLQICPLYAGFLLLRTSLPGASRAVVFAGSMTFWAAWQVFWFRLLGTLSVLSLGAVMAPALVLALLTGWRLARSCSIADEFTGILRYWRRGVLRQAPVTTGLLCLLSVFILARALCIPPLAWDSLTYHLVHAAHWVRTGSLGPFFGADGMDSYSHFTENGNILAACFMLPFHADTLVGLLNFPCLLWLGSLIYALGREFGLAHSFCLLLALVVCTAPMNLAYVTTAYVDIQVNAEMLCAILFLFRFARSGRMVDALVLLASVGLALGTKPSAAPICALCGGALVLLELLRRRRFGSRPRLLLFLWGMLLVGALGCEKYVLNTLETGSPFYPIGVNLFGYETQSSGYVLKVFEEIKAVHPQILGDQLWRDLANLHNQLRYREDLGTVRSAGPVFGLLGLGGICFLLQALYQLGRKEERPEAWRKLALFSLFFIPFILFYTNSSDSMKFSRRYWIHESARFLAASFSLLGICALLAVPRNRRFRRLVRWLLLLALLPNLYYANYELLFPAESLLLAVTAIFLLWLALRGGMAIPIRVAAVVTLGFWASWLQQLRDETRAVHYAKGLDLHAIPRDEIPQAWEFLDDPPNPKTIAYTTGWAHLGHNWFVYPLMGRRLQNKVVYASVNRLGTYPTSLDRGLMRETGDKSTWLQNLKEQEVDFVLVQAPWPMELPWMQSDERQFVPVMKRENYFLFRFKR